MKKVIGQVPKLEISTQEFQELSHAKKVLRNALFLEEKFEILLSNFVEFEQDVEKETLNNLFINIGTYSVALKQRLLFERRLANLLTSTKTYIDQVPSKVRDCFANTDGMLAKAKSFLSSEYDSSLHYRFMEMLRNYVQHKGIAIHLVKLYLKKIDGKFVNSIHLISYKADLAKDKVNKRVTINELPDEINIMEASRHYIYSLTQVHNKCRLEIQSQVSIARELFENTIKKYSEYCDPLGLNAFSGIDANSESFPILLDWDDIRLELIEKNKGFYSTVVTSTE